MTNSLNKIKQMLTEESALFKSRDLIINDSVFADGESPLKEIRVISINNSIIKAPKTFRHASNTHLTNIDVPNAAESFRNCIDVSLTNVTTRGDYFGMNNENIKIENFRLAGFK